ILEIDQMARLGQAQLHHRDQAVPASDDADIVTMAREDGDGLVEGPRAMILERRGYHVVLLPWFATQTPKTDERSTTRNPQLVQTSMRRAGFGKRLKTWKATDLQEMRNRRT